MPLKTFQENYWIKGNANAAASVVSKSGYPSWQVTVLGSLFGALHAYVVVCWRRLVWWVRIWQQIRHLPVTSQRLVGHTLKTLEHPGFTLAQQAVRQTATTMRFNRPEMWVPYSRMLKSHPNRAENIFRHVKAGELLTEALAVQGGTLTNPERHFLTELAYQEFALRGR